MASLVSIYRHLNKLYCSTATPADSKVYDACFCVQLALRDGCRPSYDWQDLVQQARDRGDLSWRT